MKKIIKIACIFSLLGCAILTGCSAHNLKAPCPDFGASCSKTPINSWNDN